MSAIPTLDVAYVDPISHCPAHKLVDDTLYAIFLTACLDDEAPLNTPNTLSHVNQRWRGIALATPRLWTKITVRESVVRLPTTYSPKKPKFLATLDKVKAFFDRSRSLALDVTIDLTSTLPDNDKSQVEIVSRLQANFRFHTRKLSLLLSQHLDRLRRLRITVDEYPCLLNLHAHFKPGTYMPHLRFLEIDVYQCAFKPPVTGPLLYNHTSPGGSMCRNFHPSLTHALLKGVPVGHFQFAPKNLTELYLIRVPKDCRPTWPKLRVALETNGQTLDTLHIDFAPPSCTDDYLLITLPHLKSLIITYTKRKHLLRLIDAFDVPNLEFLSITDGERAEAFPLLYDTPRIEGFYAVLTALMESFPLGTLKKLELAHIWFFPGYHEETGGEISDPRNLDICGTPFFFFSALESLEVLVLVAPTTTPLDMLNYSGCSEDFLELPMPQIRELHLSLFNKHVVRDFLQTRRYLKFGDLDVIRLQMPHEWEDDFYLRLRHLCEQPEVELVSCGSPRMFKALNEPPHYWQGQLPPRVIFENVPASLLRISD